MRYGDSWSATASSAIESRRKRWAKRGRWPPTTARAGVTRTAAFWSPCCPRPGSSSPQVLPDPGFALPPPSSRPHSPTPRLLAAPAGARAPRRLPRSQDLMPTRTVIGVVSDTHGLLRPEAVRRLRGVDRIVHAGDVGTPDVLRALEAIAPVTAVRGNNDRGAWARALPETATLTVEAARLYVLHDVKMLAVDPRRAAFAVVIAGHSHKPSAVDRDGVLFLNPG